MVVKSSATTYKSTAICNGILAAVVRESENHIFHVQSCVLEFPRDGFLVTGYPSYLADHTFLLRRSSSAQGNERRGICTLVSRNRFTIIR